MYPHPKIPALSPHSSPTLPTPAETALIIATLYEACEAALEHILDTAGAENELAELLQGALDSAT